MRVHTGEVCAATLKRELGFTPADVLADAQKQWCPECGRATAKDGGCNHMTCTCGAHWCWTCGKAVDRRDPSSHYRDSGVVASAAAVCDQFVYGARTEHERVLRVLMCRSDLTPDMRELCVKQWHAISA
jgi:hypothetical protein